MHERIFVLDAIRSNRRRIILGVFVFFLVVVLEVALIAAIITLINISEEPTHDNSEPPHHHGWKFFMGVFLVFLAIAFFLAPFFWVWSYFWGRKRIPQLFRPARLSEAEKRKLNLAVDGVCIGMGQQKPEVRVIDYAGINAISMVKRHNRALIMVTGDAVVNLERRELEALLAHEMCHVASHDTSLWMLGLGMGIFAPLLVLNGAGARWTSAATASYDSGPKLSPSDNIYCWLIAFFWMPMWLAFYLLVLPHGREELADAEAILVTRDPEGLASLLYKADRMRSYRIPFFSVFIGHMFFHKPFEPMARYMRKFYGLFDRHPEASERISLIESMN